LIVDNMWLKSHLDDHDLVVIDGRGAVAYSSGHIKNALPLGLDDVISISENGANLAIEGEAAENLFGKLGIDESKKVVVYGEHFDPSAARIAWTLLYNGHNNTSLLETAFSFIRRGTLPIVRDLPKPVVTNFISRPNDCLRADERMVKEKLNDNGTVIIDSRTPLEHTQARIPGSLLHNWENGIGDDGKMIKSGEVLLNEFNASGIAKNKEIICYCHSGTRASHKYFQFKHAGFRNVRCYDGSIIDWTQRRNPIR
jgi:thiosulfate/3-mercaptopyruvate sulfurtransferase